MGNRLLVAIPTRDMGGDYPERIEALKETWLKDCPIDHLLFSDQMTGIAQDNAVRQRRMVWLCKYAFDKDYDFLLRCDTDTYVWIDRLLASDFREHDYVGYSLAWYDHHPKYARFRTAHGGAGFTLSRKAMQVIIKNHHFFPQGSPPIYWGDIWTGMLLHDHDIRLHRDERFKDLQGKNEDPRPGDVPEDLITLHPVTPTGMRAFHRN